jgi:hypothetical protein
MSRTTFARSGGASGVLFAAGALAAGLLSGCAAGTPSLSSPVITASEERIAPRKSAAYLYVANTAVVSAGGQRIEIFLQSDPAKGPVDSIRRGISEPDGIFVDGDGTLYVANADESGNDKVTVYPRGAHKPSRAYAGAVCAFDVAVGTDRSVYVADACGVDDVGRVIIFAKGSSTATGYLYPGGAPYCLAIDAKNNLYVGYNARRDYAGQVKRYAPGSAHGEKLLPAGIVHFLTAMAFDGSGALVVANQAGGTIDVFARRHQPPTRVIKTGPGQPFSFAFDREKRRIYVSHPCESGGLRSRTASGCGKGTNTVVALDYASGRRLWTQTEPLWIPMGVATLPSAPL